ncbi:hypothetical protein BC831DRAFT_445139 [Entophlyctis helioformis]|nr:hypothetical protein BC831DRAFT_445139 [Entophlyctis helioformis]
MADEQMADEQQQMADESTETLHELDAIRTKLSHLVESLNEILVLHPSTPWPPVLDQLNTILARFESVQGELLGTPGLREALVQPHMLLLDDPEFIPRVLLRTKLIPEIEDQERATVVAAQSGWADGNDGGDGRGGRGQTGEGAGAGLDVNPMDHTAVRLALQEWENKADQHDALIQAALEIYSDVRQELEPTLKGRARAAASASSASAGSFGSSLAPSSLSSASGSGPGSRAALGSSTSRSQRSTTSLEKTLAWLSSGPPHE